MSVVTPAGKSERRLNLKKVCEELAEAARYDARKLAKLCHISPRHLQREFHRLFGQSPQVWLNQRRLMAARQLLLAGEPVKNVAANLGYKQTSHFCRQFKSLNHVTPSEFVARQKANAVRRVAPR